MKLWRITLIAVVVVTALAGCGGSEATPAPADTGDGGVNTRVALGDSYKNALPVSSQLALGAFQLEGTKDAVTSEQASALLLLWRAIQAGTLQGETETSAVLKQIEGEMMPEQLEVINSMQLTWADSQAWAESRGLSLGPSPEELAARQAAGSGQGLSPEAQATRQATRKGSGSGPGGDLSEEEREAMRATAEASGMAFGGRGFGGMGQPAILAEPLIELLTQRAAE